MQDTVQALSPVVKSIHERLYAVNRRLTVIKEFTCQMLADHVSEDIGFGTLDMFNQQVEELKAIEVEAGEFLKSTGGNEK